MSNTYSLGSEQSGMPIKDDLPPRSRAGCSGWSYSSPAGCSSVTSSGRSPRTLRRFCPRRSRCGVSSSPASEPGASSSASASQPFSTPPVASNSHPTSTRSCEHVRFGPVGRPGFSGSRSLLWWNLVETVQQFGRAGGQFVLLGVNQVLACRWLGEPGVRDIGWPPPREQSVEQCRRTNHL